MFPTGWIKHIIDFKNLLKVTTKLLTIHVKHYTIKTWKLTPYLDEKGNVGRLPFNTVTVLQFLGVSSLTLGEHLTARFLTKSFTVSFFIQNLDYAYLNDIPILHICIAYRITICIPMLKISFRFYPGMLCLICCHYQLTSVSKLIIYIEMWNNF